MDAPEDADDADGDPTSEPRRLAPGTKVEVRTRLERSRWGPGFRVISVGEDGYELERSSDGATMPVRFAFEDVRQERRRGTWWY